MATEEEHVKLLSFWASPFAMRAILALELKGVKYEVVEEDLRDKSQLLLESNPVYKKIPVLLHRGKAISESFVIVRYVDEAWPGAEDGSNAFFPKDPYGRAVTSFWADFIEKKVMDLTLKLMRLKGDEKEATLKELYDNIMTLETSGFVKLDAKPFLNGTTMGFADIILAPLASLLTGLQEVVGLRVPSVEEAPHFHKFCSAVFEHPAAKVAFPDPQKLLTFLGWLKQRLNPST